ncbi:hypothetical protein [Trichormus variabilis]|uniref:Uncharacterized protein n=1 Tax=Trichormus variabilis SAG 1403-4b TaxID=447716 RepID=A0A433UTX4_ANAVA|nr:hypothetical protein [Trichormus variabilis]MBD2627922.1 hypothetical protein [Trichormus variabilis FACHB-164]RUS97303.1 hypothetical protein DSM107003_20440 [Trichormus variabilis SAG 1403-4b]
MAKHSRKLTQKVDRINQPRTGAIKKRAKKSQKQPRWRSWLLSTLALTILLGSAGIIIASGWISILFILNPEQVSWLNEILPEWAQLPLSKSDRPQTLSAIQLSLSQKNRIAGETISLDDQQQKSFLLPVFQKRANCQSNCQELLELRVYQRSKSLEFRLQPEKYYNLVTQMSVTGLTESFVKAPFGETASDTNNQEGKKHLSFTEVKAFEDSTLSPGFWFYVRGEHKQEDSSIVYGQIYYYNPGNSSLEQMLSWKNPNGQLPKWQQVTGSAAKELVIDQTTGLEPHLQVYQVKSGQLATNSLVLEEINLQSEFEDFGYQKSLLLARNGMWTPALAWLTSLQKNRQQPFPEAVQAQIDLIRLHSQLTKSQADKISASPSQQVLTDLIDGRWEKALQIFTASSQNAQEIATLLKADRGRLWNRTAVALRLNPNRQSVLAWTYLMLALQRGEQRATSWLQEQPNINQKNFTYFQDLLAKLNYEVTTTHLSQIIGGVQQVTLVNDADWVLIPGTADLKITDNQVWYQVEVSAFHNHVSWLSSPFTNLNPPKTQSSQFWAKILGISADPTIQIIVWLENGEQQINPATIKAVQLRNGVLRLLAVGTTIPQTQNNSLQPKPLALTPAALEWVQPSPITVQELYQQNPQVVRVMLENVWRSLQQSGDMPLSGAVPKFPEMQVKMGDWPVQLIDVTNDGNLDVVLTISGAAIESLNQSASIKGGNVEAQKRPRTLIFSNTGKVIYNDFSPKSQQALSAIAHLANDPSLTLLVENAHKYSLKRWSGTNQRFE